MKNSILLLQIIQGWAMIELLSDNEITKINEDLIGLNRISESLRGAIIHAKTPLTIGVYGDWGAGKTSVLRMTKSSLDSHKEAKNNMVQCLEV
jgi:ABC-type Na+ transport system ATPase subunit NatA